MDSSGENTVVGGTVVVGAAVVGAVVDGATVVGATVDEASVDGAAVDGFVSFELPQATETSARELASAATTRRRRLVDMLMEVSLLLDCGMRLPGGNQPIKR